MNTCALCRARFEADSPAILFISAYGSKRVLCSSCEALLDAATEKEDSQEKAEAIASIDALSNAIKDPETFDALTSILSGEAEEDTLSEEEEAEMEAVFEEVEREEAAAPKEKSSSVLFDYVLPAALVLALVGFVVWFYFF